MRLFGANFLLQELPPEIKYRPVTILTHDQVLTRGILYWREGVTPRVGVHLMHPRTDQSQNYNIVALAQAGFAVLGRAGRGVNNDVDTVHEILMPDFAAGVRFLREEVGCERVLLVGNSGGSTLAAMYQWQARTPPPGRLVDTAAGDRFDLNEFDLPPADGIAFIGGHVGEGGVMLKYIDPSVGDEHDALAADPSLDMYDPMNGYREPPESTRCDDEFVERYRRAQYDRIRRLDALARHLLAEERLAAAAAPLIGQTSTEGVRRFRRRAGGSTHMIIYRTAADLASMDLGLDPDDRIRGSYLHPRPDLENFAGPGFARYITPRAWLSTWSGLSTRAQTIPCLQAIRDPLLIVHYAGDEGCRMTEVQAMLAASASDDKQLKVVRHANHYGRVLKADGTKGGQTTEGTTAIVDWAVSRFKP